MIDMIIEMESKVSGCTERAALAPALPMRVADGTDNSCFRHVLAEAGIMAVAAENETPGEFARRNLHAFARPDGVNVWQRLGNIDRC